MAQPEARHFQALYALAREAAADPEDVNGAEQYGFAIDHFPGAEPLLDSAKEMWDRELSAVDASLQYEGWWMGDDRETFYFILFVSNPQRIETEEVESQLSKVQWIGDERKLVIFLGVATEGDVR